MDTDTDQPVARMDAAADEITELRAQLAAVTESHCDARADRDRLRDENRALLAAMTAMTERLDARTRAEGTTGFLTSQLTQARRDIDILQAKNRRLITALSEMADRNGVLTAERDSAVNDSAQFAADVAALTARLENVARRLA